MFLFMSVEGDRTSAYFQSQPATDLNSSAAMYDRPPSTQPPGDMRSASSSRLEQSSRVEFASNVRSAAPILADTQGADLGFELIECHVERTDGRLLGLSLSNQNSVSSSKVDSRTSSVSFRDDQSGELFYSSI